MASSPTAFFHARQLAAAHTVTQQVDGLIRDAAFLKIALGLFVSKHLDLPQIWIFMVRSPAQTSMITGSTMGLRRVVLYR